MNQQILVCFNKKCAQNIKIFEKNQDSQLHQNHGIEEIKDLAWIKEQIKNGQIDLIINQIFKPKDVLIRDLKIEISAIIKDFTDNILQYGQMIEYKILKQQDLGQDIWLLCNEIMKDQADINMLKSLNQCWDDLLLPKQEMSVTQAIYETALRNLNKLRQQLIDFINPQQLTQQIQENEVQLAQFSSEPIQFLELNSIEGKSKFNISIDKINTLEKMEISIGLVDQSIFQLQKFNNKLFDYEIDINDLKVTEKETSEHIGSAFTSACYSPDGKYLATGEKNRDTNQGIVRIWNAQDGQEYVKYDHVYGLCFSNDSKTLVSSCYDYSIIAYDVENKNKIGTGQHDNYIDDVCISPDNRYIVSGSSDKTIKIWQLNEMKEIDKIILGQEVIGVCFSPDGNLLASCGADRKITIWDFKERRMIGKPLTGHTKQVNRVSFSKDGNKLLSTSNDQTIRIWSVLRQECIGELKNSQGPLWNGFFFADDKMIVSSGFDDQSVRIWNSESFQSIGRPLHGLKGPVYGMAISHDEKTLMGTSYMTSYIKKWNLEQKIYKKLSGALLINQDGEFYNDECSEQGYKNIDFNIEDKDEIEIQYNLVKNQLQFKNMKSGNMQLIQSHVQMQGDQLRLAIIGRNIRPRIK